MPSPRLKNKPKASNTALRLELEWSFTAIGTQWWIGIYETLPAATLKGLQRAIAERIESFDKTYSRFRNDSLITKIAHSAGTYDLPADGQKLLAFYRQLYEVSDGLVTPLIGQVLSDAGYDASYSLKPGELAVPPAWEDGLEVCGLTLITKQPVLLDFGAAGKGYLVDIVSQVLIDASVSQFCVDAGGDMYCHGLDDDLMIGLEHPDNDAQVLGVACMRQGSLCGSAGNRRKWAGYHHIMHPTRLQPVNTIKAVWVTAEDALTADGLATALFFVPPARLQAHFSFTYCLVQADNSVEMSVSFPAQLFTAKDAD
jgi:FAD:protein FMN transferase